MPIAGLLLLCSCAAKQNETPVTTVKELPYKVMLVQRSELDTAWGYIILDNNRHLIQQFSIPALDGDKAFASRQQASAVGNLVAYKLNHAQPPGITKNELDSLGIIQ